MPQQQNSIQYDKNRQLHAETTPFQEQHHDYKQAMQVLASQVQGELIFPGNSAYEVKRQVWNGAVDRHPAVIVSCLNADDVKAGFSVKLSESGRR